MYDVLRVIHVLAGILLGGALFFEIFILRRRLQSLGSAIERAVTVAISPAIGIAHGLSSLVIVGTGIAITLMQRNLSSLVTSAWGWAIILGTVATLGFIAVGITVHVPTGNRLENMSKSIKGRPPTPEESQTMHLLTARMDKYSNINFGFIIIALATMFAARLL